jgi:hypothetical protein
VGTVSAPSDGATFEKVMFATEVTGEWNGSKALSVAVTNASSLHVTVGDSVFVFPSVQTVPGEAVVANVHEVATGSLSGSIAEPFSVAVPPSGDA